MITQDTYAPTNRERRGDWYAKVAHVEGYELMTGPRTNYAYEYARSQMLDAAPSDTTPWLSYGDLSHGF